MKKVIKGRKKKYHLSANPKSRTKLSKFRVGEEARHREDGPDYMIADKSSSGDAIVVRRIGPPRIKPGDTLMYPVKESARRMGKPIYVLKKGK